MHNIEEKKSGHARATDLRWLLMLAKFLKMLRIFVIMITNNTKKNIFFLLKIPIK